MNAAGKFDDERWFELFNRHDPCGLIACGAPRDEYLSEIAAVSSAIGACKTEDEVRDLVWTTFVKYNGSAFPVQSSCFDLASELWRILH